jgi:hypothetical protein
MPEKKTVERAKRAKRQGRSPSTQAGEFVREEMHHVRRGKHGARSARQAIAIGLSKARRAGVGLRPPGRGKTTTKSRQSAKRAYEVGQGKRAPRAPSARRSRATAAALRREGRSAASRQALSRQARSAARKRTAGERSASARQAARTKGPAARRKAAAKAVRSKGPARRSAAARKAARTRGARS